jgi:hypothetical protein
MALLFVWFWAVGGIPAAILGEVVRADNPRIVRAGRIAFAFLLAVDLLLAAVIFSAGQDSPSSHMTRSLWWFTVIVAGVPLALFSGFAVRRGYRGKRRLALLVATLTTAALYLAFPLGFVPDSRPRLTGLGLWAHEHHLLGIAILLVPTLILLVSELRLNVQVEPEPEPEPDRVSLGDRIAAIPRRYLVGGGVLLAILVWTSGTNGPGLLLGFGVGLAVLALFLWRWHRSVMQSVQRDLRPPQKL